MIAGKTGWLRLLGCCLALAIAACAPKIYETPYVPPPAPQPQPPPPVVKREVFYVAVKRLNLRGCAGMDCPKIGVLEQNEAVEKLGEMDDWFEVVVKRTGSRGWVTARYLSPEPVTPTPEVAPPAAAPSPPPLREVYPATPAPREAYPSPPPRETYPSPAPVEKPAPAPKPPAAEKPERPKPGEVPAPPKKKPEETRPAKPARPGEGAEPVKPKPPAEKPRPPAEKPKPEKPAPPGEPEQPKRIRIM